MSGASGCSELWCRSRFLYILHKSQGTAKETLKCHPKNLLLSINTDLHKTELYEELRSIFRKIVFVRMVCFRCAESLYLEVIYQICVLTS